MKLITMFVFISLLTGCGALTGMKKVDAWGFKAEFVTGADFHVGANGIDRVQDRRGIQPDNSKDDRY